MDLYCPVCGEAWDFDTLHEEAQERYGVDYYLYDSVSTTGWLTDPRNRHKNPNWNADEYDKYYKKVSAEFRVKGCKALSHITSGQSCIPVPRNEDTTDRTFGLTRSEAASALYDVLGEDLDGAAAMMEDMGF